MQLPYISSYGEYSSSNYGAHTLTVGIGGMRFYYSYDTIVAFSDENGLHVSENVWGVTTGKHLNWIDSDHSSRLPHAKFTQMLADSLKRHNITGGE